MAMPVRRPATLFSTIADHGGDLLAGRANGKYSPVEVAAWLDGFATASEKALAEARNGWRECRIPPPGRRHADRERHGPLLRRQAARRAAVRNLAGDKRSQGGALALDSTRVRDAWAAMAERARQIYVADVSYGHAARPLADRLAGIDKDIDAMRTATPQAARAAAIRRYRKGNTGLSPSVIACRHAVPAAFRLRRTVVTFAGRRRAGPVGAVALSPCQPGRTLA